MKDPVLNIRGGLMVKRIHNSSISFNLCSKGGTFHQNFDSWNQVQTLRQHDHFNAEFIHRSKPNSSRFSHQYARSWASAAISSVSSTGRDRCCKSPIVSTLFDLRLIMYRCRRAAQLSVVSVSHRSRTQESGDCAGPVQSLRFGFSNMITSRFWTTYMTPVVL